MSNKTELKLNLETLRNRLLDNLNDLSNSVNDKFNELSNILELYNQVDDLVNNFSIENLQKAEVITEEVEKEKPYENDYSTKESTIKAILRECDLQGLKLKEQKAYVLATVDWETGHTFKPVREAPNLSEEWRQKNLRYYPYYGRGFVQLTWEENYKRFSKIIGYDFVKDPDKVMEPDISLFILVYGIKNGSFTGKKLEDYINSSKNDTYNARRVVNGTDKAREIANIAEEFLKSEYLNG